MSQRMVMVVPRAFVIDHWSIILTKFEGPTIHPEIEPAMRAATH